MLKFKDVELRPRFYIIFVVLTTIGNVICNSPQCCDQIPITEAFLECMLLVVVASWAFYFLWNTRCRICGKGACMCGGSLYADNKHSTNWYKVNNSNNNKS